MKKIFILAGEPSGDIHGARLMKSILEREPGTKFIGIGGEKMIATGIDSLIPLDKMSVVGMWEVFKKLNFFSAVLKQCKEVIETEKPDVFIPIDYPGFNIRLASYAKQTGIPVLYYIAPQLWAWGKNRAEKIKGNVDLLLTVLPFEEDFFRKYGIETRYVGHPLLDDEFYTQEFLPFEKRDKIIAIFPGSRKQEILKHNELIKEISNEINKQIPGYELVVAKSNNIDDSYYSEIKQYACISSDTKFLLRNSTAGIIKTGTTNLEAALSGLPANMFYRTSWMSYNIGKHLINIDYLSIINILMDKQVVREFIQQDANAELIIRDIKDLVTNAQRYETLLIDYRTIRQKLGKGGASQRAAEIILNYLNG